jgi:predicted deacylase
VLFVYAAIHGFLHQSRYLPDRRDLNRFFPGSWRGSIAARTADTFIRQVVAKSDCGIDLHTAAINRSNLPQIRANLADLETSKLAKLFGARVVEGQRLASISDPLGEGEEGIIAPFGDEDRSAFHQPTTNAAI